MKPLLTVVIPSKGRRGLLDTLASIPNEPWVETVVVADGEDAWRRVRDACDRPRTRLFHCGPSAVGHPQRTFGIGKARGKWLSFIDDDDLYTKAAFPAFRDRINEDGGLPVIFRMEYLNGRRLWDPEQHGRSVVAGNVGTPMILCRNNDRLGAWEPVRQGDFTFIRETVERSGGVEWDETVVALVRCFGPDAPLLSARVSSDP